MYSNLNRAVSFVCIISLNAAYIVLFSRISNNFRPYKVYFIFKLGGFTLLYAAEIPATKARPFFDVYVKKNLIP